MTKRFYSNGKLLLTGEYVVLDGALSLAVPTKYGQSLTVKEADTAHITWKSYDEKAIIWFERVFKMEELEHISIPPFPNYKSGITTNLLKILSEAKKLNPSFLRTHNGYEVESMLDFPRNWGLGSSSTLINNIAQWAEIDAYELLWRTFSGSGYDIACALHNKPILYELKNGVPFVKEAAFNPPFKDQLYFVYLEKKQNSREAIDQYRKQRFDKGVLISQITEITQEIIDCTTMSGFNTLVTRHEALISEVLNIPTVKESQFQDYEGAIKSLGAWGGDFVLATGDNRTPDYFEQRGYRTVIPYSKMVL